MASVLVSRVRKATNKSRFIAVTSMLATVVN